MESSAPTLGRPCGLYMSFVICNARASESPTGNFEKFVAAKPRLKKAWVQPWELEKSKMAKKTIGELLVETLIAAGVKPLIR